MKRTMVEKRYNIIIEDADIHDSRYMFHSIGDERSIRYADTLKEIDIYCGLLSDEYSLLMHLA